MTRLFLDAGLLARLQNLSDLTEVCDESGRILGYFHPLKGTSEAGSARTPFSREEVEKFRQQKTGRPLADILADLR